MKYLLSLSLLALLLASCSKETIEQENSADLSAQISSNNLNYKGIFATLDSKHRATVTIEIPTSSNTAKGIQPKAVITFSNGKTVEAFAENTISTNKAVENLTFKGNNLSFNFSSTASGEDAIISDAVYNNVATSIKIAPVRLGDPLPVTYLGTYECTDCGTHPVLGTGEMQTFNVMIANGGLGATTDITTQIVLGSTDFGSSTGNEQMDCEGIGDSATSCPIDGSSFNSLITWEGNHYVDFAEGCEGVSGTWEYDSPNHGLLNGTFISDNACVTEVTLIDEDFEDSMVLYATSVPEFSDGSGDYFIRTDGSDIGGGFDNFTNVQGTSYFAAQDIDGEVPDANQFINFNNLDISGLTNIEFSAYFAEDDDGTNEDYDASDFVNVEYSFDGTTYTPFFAIRNDGSTFNTAPQVDTDLDGIGDGTVITQAFEIFNASFDNNITTNPTSSNTVNIRISINLNGGDEDIAIDDVLVVGN